MSNIIVFAPPKILMQSHADEWLEAVGKDSIILTCNNARQSIEAHFGTRLKLVFFKNFNNNHFVEKRAFELAISINATNVVALAEIDLLRAARVRDRLGISIGDEEKLIFFRDKFKMKKLAAMHGFAIAEMRLFSNAFELLDFVEEIGYPAVVKPVDGRGSNGVNILKNESDLDSFLSSDGLNKYGEMLVEAYVSGDMYQANGFYQDGKLRCISVVRCVNSCFEFLKGKSLGLQMLSDESVLRSRIVEYADTLLTDALPTPHHSLFHLEVFVDDEQQITLCEVGARLGGCVVNEEIYEAYGINLRMELIKSMRNTNYKLENIFSEYQRLMGQLNIPPEEGILKSIERECPFPWVRLYRVNGSEGTYFSEMSFTNAEIVNILVEAENENQIRERFELVETWFRNTTKYELREST